MALLPETYTQYADQIEPQMSWDPLPAGEYLAMITESEWKDASTGHGNKYLQFTFEVVEGEYKGRKFWDRLNLVNQNQTAVEIAHRTLSAICHAVGKVRAKDSQELHNIPLLVKLSIKQGPNGPTNEVRGYKAANGNGAPVLQPASAVPAGSGTPTPPPQQAAKPRPPWAR